MPIYGNIEEAGLPDVLQLLALGRKTGCLSVDDGTLHGEIYLEIGRINYASVANRDRLGEMLVKSGRITREQLNEATAQQTRGSNRPIGRILVDSGRIDRASIERFVQLQVEEAVYFMFTWKKGTFAFTSDQRPAHGALLVSLDAEGLLLEGARRVDEWSLIQKKIPSFDLVYQRTKAARRSGGVADELTEDQRRILPLLDGTRDVAGIVDVTGLTEFDVGKALYGLVMAGFAQLVERRSRVRHLDYRELLAYVVREAEFADAQRRKDAARHIVDCPACSERLRTIHVRRTEGMPLPATAEVPAQSAPAEPAPRPEPATVPVPALRVPGAAAAAAPAAVAAAPAPAAAPAAVVQAGAAAPAPATVTAPPGYVRERRTGRDRRHFERRAGLDRRQAVSSAWTHLNDRRRAERRQGERRRTPGAQYAAAPGAAGAVTLAAAAVAAPMSDMPLHRPERRGGRTTGPRQLRAFEPDSPRAVPAASPPHGVEVAAAAHAFPAPPSADLRPDTAATVEVQPVAPRSAPATEPGLPSRELVWLMSPEESLQLIRASQTQARPAPAPTSERTTEVAVPPPVEPPARPSPAPPKAARPAPPPVERRVSPPAPRPASAVRRADEQPAREPRKQPLRHLAIAAGVAGVALLGFLAGQLGRRGPSASPAAETTATPLTETAAAQAPPRTATQLAARPEEPRPQPPASSPATRTPTAVATRPAPSEREPRLAPAPVAATPAATRAAAPATPAPAQPVAAPPPTVGSVRGTVRDASGRAIAGARVTVRGAALAATTDGAGAFELRDVPEGTLVLQVAADGYQPGSAEVRARGGAAVAADVTLAAVPAAQPPAAAPAAAPAPPVAAAPSAAAGDADRELAAGGWTAVSRAEAAELLGGALGGIQGLGVESVTRSTTGTRARVRVAQVTPAGERIVLTLTRAGAAVRPPGPLTVTALRVMPPSEAYPYATGTASLGNLLITAKASIPADALRGYLERLGELR